MYFLTSFHISKQCALAAQKANCNLSPSEEGWPVGPSLLCLCEAHLEYCVQVWGPQHRKDVELLERVQRRATKMIRGLVHLSYEDRLKELGSFNLEKRKLWGDLFMAFQYFKEDYKQEGNIFTWVGADGAKGSGFELMEERFRLDLRGR